MGVDGTTLSIQHAAVHPLVQALRNPQGVRQAIILSEILNRPRSLR
jgi:alcohol dehydrogenase class IV